MNIISLLKVSVTIVAVMLATILLAAEQEVDQNEFLLAATQMREEWKRLEVVVEPISETEMKELRTMTEKWSKLSTHSVAIANYFIARFTMTEKRQDMEMRSVVSSLSISMLPEGVAILITPTNTRRSDNVNFYKQYLAKLFSISLWQRYYDLGLSAKLDDINPTPPLVPRLDYEVMLLIATEFEQAMLWDLAWRAYAEAIYACKAPTFCGNKVETWLSPETGSLWVKVAECAYKAGKKDLAMDYLMKAAVFGADDLQKTVKEKATLWLAKPAPNLKSEQVDKNVKRKFLTKVVESYMEINVHPRAFQLLDDYRDVFENSEGLRKQAEQQWLAIIKHTSVAISNHGDITNKIIFYGHEVYPKGDPLKVRIPWAFSDEAVASVRNRLKESISREPIPASSKKVETDK